MKNTAIIYSFRANKTTKAADKIVADFGGGITKIDSETISAEDFAKYDNLILGVPTWFDGELPTYWDEFVPTIEQMDLSKKSIAIFGNGDQVGYTENFGDAVGIMADIVSMQGAKVVGETSTEGYTFESSLAVRNNKFVGLVLDFENQSKLNDKRIAAWVEELKKSFS